jgi:hypothetical protein
MAGSGGGGGTQTVRTELDPAIRPFVEYGLREAQAQYQQGPLEFFPGQTYIGPSGMTQQGMQMAQQRALQGSPLVQGAQQTVGAVQTAINPALGAFGDVYGRAMNDPSAGFYQQMMGGQFGNMATAPTAQTAAGAYLGGNPFFQGAFQPAARAAQDVFNQGIQGVSSQASQAGRYGSGAMGQLQDRASTQFAQSLSDVAGQLAFQNYSQERGLQEAAMGRLGALGQQDIQNMLSGAQNLSGITQQGLQTQLAAAGGMGQTAASDFARQLQAAGMAPTLAAQDYADIQRLIDLGQMQEGYQEMALADAMNRFNFQQAAPQASLQSYLSAAFGSPMGAQTSQPIFRNQLGGAAFGGLAGAGLGQLAGFNPMLGAAGGALAGGLLG